MKIRTAALLLHLISMCALIAQDQISLTAAAVPAKREILSAAHPSGACTVETLSADGKRMIPTSEAQQRRNTDVGYDAMKVYGGMGRITMNGESNGQPVVAICQRMSIHATVTAGGKMWKDTTVALAGSLRDTQTLTTRQGR